MREVSIVGVGIHKYGRFEGKPFQDIGREAVIMALKDANIEWKDVQTAYCSRQRLPSSTGAKTLADLGKTGIPIVDIEAACASGAAALKHAYMAVASEFSDIALAFGVEKVPRGFMDPSFDYSQWQVHAGMSTNPSYWAMKARRHMEKYGTTELQIAKVAYKNHKNSVHNPYSMYQKAFTLEEILGSRLVCDPIRLLEICAPNEGAAAAIVCPKSMARKFTSKPIDIAAVVHQTALYAADFRVPQTSLSAKIANPGPTVVTSRKAYDEAGIGPEDLDLAEVQDTDAFCEIEIYEDLGLCEYGEGGRLIDDGVTEIGGKIPVSVSGGLISKGEPVGASHLGQIFEIVCQLRGEAGVRQVANAKVGLAQVLGAVGQCATTILKK
ncbi:thiolase family protein [Chloroflexota bacterium]